MAKTRYFCGDFETTVFNGQESTEVWASASVELNTEDVYIFHSIDEQFEYFEQINSPIICYYHNLKFDGNFWLSFLLAKKEYSQAILKTEDGVERFVKAKEMPNKSISYIISSMGQWYSITIKTEKGQLIELRDSLKLLPFSLKRIGESFKTKHRKLEMEYKGYRYAGCEITKEEKEYIANDVLVLKEALEFMFQNGHKQLTIGSCCLTEFKHGTTKVLYKENYPDLYQIPLPEEYGSPNAGEYIKKSYRGGWCYLAKGKEKQIKKNGCTADVNSLYPSMMHSESGNYYPIGMPTFWKGNNIPSWLLNDTENEYYWFIRIKTRFKLKEGMLPFIQIKSTFLYKGTEMLETSDIYNSKTGKYSKYYIDLDGNKQLARVEMTMTMTDYILFRKHYNVSDFEILDGCYFVAEKGLFDSYIDKYKQIKISSTGAMRELAKLFLNNLYGKMASSPVSNFKIAYVDENGIINYRTVLARDKTPGYIAIGSAITSYARNFTIRAAQKNYYGKDKRGFIYADTDSIHCDLKPEELKGITVHPKNFCCWKVESTWDEGYFVRQKTYIEHIIEEDCVPVEEPYYSVRCAGMPQKCKDLFLASVQGVDAESKEIKEKYTDYEREFLKVKREMSDFDVGLIVPGKLLPKRIKGGVVLKDTLFEMRDI